MLNVFQNNLRRLIAWPSLEWILLGASLLPFFLISAYNQPTDDDFLLATQRLTDSFIAFQRVLYLNWGGRYTSGLLWSLGYSGGDIHSWLTIIKLAPIAWLLGLIGAMYFALSSLRLSFSREQTLRFALWAVLVLLCGMPLLVSAIYWYCGAAVYTMATILTMLLVGCAGRSLQADTTAGCWLWQMLALFTIILLLGCNELCIVVVSGGIVLLLLLGPARARTMSLGWLLAMLAGGGAALLAPGNFVRMAVSMAGATKFSVGRAVVVTVKDIYLTQAHWAGWASSAPLWLASLLFVPVALQLHARLLVTKSSRAKWLAYPHVLLPVIVLLAGIMLMTGLPTLWFSNDIPQRVWNYTYFLFLPTWFLAVQYCVSISAPGHHWLGAMSPTVLNSLKVLFFVLILTGNGSAVNRAYVDLTFRARAYNQASAMRYAMLEQAQQAGHRTMTLPPLVEREYQYPQTIFLHDLDLRASNIENVGMASYFHLDSVYLTKPAVPTVRHLRDY